MALRRTFAGLRELIGDTLTRTLQPRVLDVVNESKLHRRGTDTHFKITVVSDKFTGLTQVQRQRLVYQALTEVWESELHSLTLTTRTLEEWESDPSVQKSPRCKNSEV
jgi:BolA protein